MLMVAYVSNDVFGERLLMSFFVYILMRVNAAAIFPHNISIAPGVEMPLIGSAACCIFSVVFCFAKL